MANEAAIQDTRWDEFRREFGVYSGQFADKGLFFLLLAAWLALFHFLGNCTFGYIDTPSLFGWMWVASTSTSIPGTPLEKLMNADDGYCLMMPLLVLVLFWHERQRLVAVPRRLWWPGLLGLALALTLHILGYLIQQPRVSIVAMLSGIYGLIALTWGWRFAVASFFPFALLAFCVPFGALAEPITVPLRQFSTDIAVGFVRDVLGIPVIQQGVQIIDPRGTYHYEVAAACSGIRSLIALFALATIYSCLTFTRIWKRGLTIATVVPLAITGNVLRLVCIVVAAQAFGPDAGEFVHNWFGFLTFALALMVLFGLGAWLRDPVPAPLGSQLPSTP